MTPTTLAIEILFGTIRPENVLNFKVAEGLLWPELTRLQHSKVPPAYMEAAHHLKGFSHHSEEEKEHSFVLAAQEMAAFWEQESGMAGRAGKASMFLTLLRVAERYLVLQDNAAVVRFEKLLAWRMLTTAIGQDLPVCAFLALHDHRLHRERLDFTWPLHLPCDHGQLRGILRNGMAENHYHLWGSLPSFHLLWLRLMGDARLHEQVLRAPLKERLHADHVSFEEAMSWPLDDLSKLASLLRWNLWRNCEGQAGQELSEDAKCIQASLQAILCEEERTQWQLSTLQEQVELDSAVAHHGLVAGYAVDYALPGKLLPFNSNDGLPLAYERFFLYSTFRRLLRNELSFSELHRFYLYLLIKAKVRREYVQVNDRVGFHNFKVYQDRKEHYGDGIIGHEKQFFEFWSARLAMTRPLREMPIRMLEARIGPPKVSESPYEFGNKVKRYVEAAQTDLKEYLRNWRPDPLPSRVDQFVEDSEIEYVTRPILTDIADRLYFVIHFSKEADHPDPAVAGPRHSHLREKLRRQSQIIWEWEESGSRWANYLRGIDAASTEIGCRPEVFAHGFRFLRLFEPSAKRLLDPEQQLVRKALRATYHVGEDFLDLIDGLRAIDEAVLYLEYRRGDRLGHALALGVDAGDWYAAKTNTIMLPLQDLVDNLAWMHARLVALGDHTHLALISKLERDWGAYYGKLVRDSKAEKSKATIHQYYLAWKLRGDEPEYYATLNDKGEFIKDHLLQPWQLSALTKHPKFDLEGLRNQPELVLLYHHYHFCPNWKKAGRAIEAYEIDSSYMRGVTALQRQMQIELRDKGIGIEANPSSNYLIGTFQRYDKHPLPSLYNLGLTYNPDELQSNPQMHISINTDDLGIFDTSLENEYALMATALGKMKHADGGARYSPAMIMDWLDRVRAMGLQQSFRDSTVG